MHSAGAMSRPGEPHLAFCRVAAGGRRPHTRHRHIQPQRQEDRAAAGEDAHQARRPADRVPPLLVRMHFHLPPLCYCSLTCSMAGVSSSLRRLVPVRASMLEGCSRSGPLRILLPFVVHSLLFLPI